MIRTSAIHRALAVRQPSLDARVIPSAARDLVIQATRSLAALGMTSGDTTHTARHTTPARLLAVLLALSILLAVPPATAAQSPAAPSSTHTRASDDGSAILRLTNLRLYLPPGAVTPGAVVGLGAGGVPAPDGSLARSSALVTAAGGLRAPAALLIAPRAADQATLAGATPALLDTADGSRHACLTAPPWIACPIARPGAYVLDLTSDPHSVDPLLREALLAVGGAERAAATRLRGAAIVVVVALAAGAGVWLLTGRAIEQKTGVGTSRKGNRPNSR